MDKLKMESKDLIQDKMGKIKEIFPSVITETKDEEGNIVQAVDFDMLRQELSSQVVEGEKERYQLTWPGKKGAMALASLPINKTLRPIKKESVDWDNTENLYIEGENLEALKLLQESYLNRVKCIYIDPPYNTGNNLLYKDNFKQDKGEYMNDSGQVDENGNRLFPNTESNGRFHSDWLSMMYPRLKLARNLLREDGVIFISIDDGEVHNLRKICDEIFGESNFISIITRVAKTTSFRGNYFAPSKDYLVCYSKNINKINTFIDKEVNEKQYNKVETEGPRKGEYYRDDIAFYLSTLETRPNQRYFIECPDGTKVIPPGETFPPERPKDGDGVWRWNKSSYESKKDLLVFKKTNHSPLIDEYGNKAKWNIYTKSYLTDKQKSGNLPRDFFNSFLNRHGTAELKKLNIPYDFPKPIELLVYLFKITSFNANDIVVDFFAGSATTAHAVMKLNAEDGGTRKYIMIQLPEPCDEKSEAYKAGYENISEIGKKRIRRAGKKIKEETGADSDYGFRVFKVDSSNMKDIYYRPEEMTQQKLEDVLSNIKEDRSAEDLLIQVMLEWGLELSLPMEKRNILDKEVHFVAGNSLIACFEEDVSEEVVKELAKEKPLRLLFRDSSFESDSERINVEELIKMLSPNTEIKVI